MIFRGRTDKDGNVRISHGNQAKLEMQKHREFDLIIRPRRKFRSTQQNKYYWGTVLRYISDETGHSEEELHMALRKKFLTCWTDKGLEFVQSTAQLSTCEFMEYIEKVRRFAATDLFVSIPDPDETE